MMYLALAGIITISGETGGTSGLVVVGIHACLAPP